MTTFYITFAPKYRTMEHPILPDIDPDGYVTVEAETSGKAYSKAHEAIGPYYDRILTEDEFNAEDYPLGHLVTIR